MTSVLLGLQAAANKLNTWDLIKNASGVVIFVMLVLLGMSLTCWYIIGYKLIYLHRASRQSEEFLDGFWKRDISAVKALAQDLRWSPLSHMFLAGFAELSKLQQGQQGASQEGYLENVERALGKAQLRETTRLESMTAFLQWT